MLVGSTIQQRLVLALTGEYPDLFQDQLPGPDHQQKCPPSMQEGKTSNVYFNTKRQCLQKSINGSILPFFGPKDIHSRCIITQVTPLTYLLDLGMNIDGYALVVGGGTLSSNTPVRLLPRKVLGTACRDRVGRANQPSPSVWDRQGMLFSLCRGGSSGCDGSRY